MKCNVYSLIGENCITLNDGQKVFDLVHPELAAGRSVELDFAGTNVFASPFFNAAIGQLLQNLSADDLNRLLTIRNLGPVGASVLRRVVENAREYYSNQKVRAAVDTVFGELATER